MKKLMIEAYASRINQYIEHQLNQPSKIPGHLINAIKYVCLSGGKRLRAALVYATAESLDVDSPVLDHAAAAVEFIHAYSLIHDDLPAMDNSDLRRGKPSCHKAFDEATAILAGDALQAMAFEQLSKPDVNETNVRMHLEMIQALALASGPAGMVGGQVLDIESEGKRLTFEQLQQLHRLKTGALIRASVQLGYLACSSLSADQQQQLSLFAEHIGFAFQIYDDILDEISSTELLGKPQGLDKKQNKSHIIALKGLEGAEKLGRNLLDTSIELLRELKLADSPLNEITLFIGNRRY